MHMYSIAADSDSARRREIECIGSSVGISIDIVLYRMYTVSYPILSYPVPQLNGVIVCIWPYMFDFSCGGVVTQGT